MGKKIERKGSASENEKRPPVNAVTRIVPPNTGSETHARPRRRISGAFGGSGAGAALAGLAGEKRPDARPKTRRAARCRMRLIASAGKGAGTGSGGSVSPEPSGKGTHILRATRGSDLHGAQNRLLHLCGNAGVQVTQRGKTNGRSAGSRPREDKMHAAPRAKIGARRRLAPPAVLLWRGIAHLAKAQRIRLFAEGAEPRDAEVDQFHMPALSTMMSSGATSRKITGRVWACRYSSAAHISSADASTCSDFARLLAPRAARASRPSMNSITR